MPTENIKRFLEEAKKVTDMPEEETDVINIELEENIIQFIKDLAKEWQCTENDVIVATIMAACNDKPQKLEDLFTE